MSMLVVEKDKDPYDEIRFEWGTEGPSYMSIFSLETVTFYPIVLLKDRPTTVKVKLHFYKEDNKRCTLF